MSCSHDIVSGKCSSCEGSEYWRDIDWGTQGYNSDTEFVEARDLSLNREVGRTGAVENAGDDGADIGVIMS